MFFIDVLCIVIASVNVEMEIVLPGNMTVIESHDIALALQHKIEGFEEVERAFVHVCNSPKDKCAYIKK